MKKELLEQYKAMVNESPRNMETAIKKYLETMAAENPAFAAKYSPERFEACFIYVVDCARQILQNKHGEVADDICYKMARDYFEDEIWREENKPQKAPKSETPKNQKPEPETVAEVVPEKKLQKATANPEQMDLFGGV